MGLFALKVVISAVVIAFASWLAGKKPELAGFIIALPLTTMIALLFSQLEWQTQENSARFARSIFAGIPLSLVFFVPFLFAGKLNLGFWVNYGLGLIFLVIGYMVHRVITNII